MAQEEARIALWGYYHVVSKGRGDQLVFEDDNDRRHYVELLEQALREYPLLLHAYVLMSNHVHLVIEDVDDYLAQFMKYVNERYARDFSKSAGRRGGIFVKPYWSEPIETDNHLLCGVRYVHANPAAAGICPASVYDWSSAKDYLGREGITHKATVLDMLGGRDGFIRWGRAVNATATPFPGSKLTRHLRDDEALRIACDIVGKDVVRQLNTMKTEERLAVVRELAQRGFQAAQLSRLTGVSESYIRLVMH